MSLLSNIINICFIFKQEFPEITIPTPFTWVKYDFLNQSILYNALVYHKYKSHQHTEDNRKHWHKGVAKSPQQVCYHF